MISVTPGKAVVALARAAMTRSSTAEVARKGAVTPGSTAEVARKGAGTPGRTAGLTAGPAWVTTEGTASGGSAGDRARAIVDARRARAAVLGGSLAEHVQEPVALAVALRAALEELADRAYRTGQQFVAPGIGRTHGVRSPLLRALGHGFMNATRRDSSSALLLDAHELLGQPELEARWFAFGILGQTLPRERERTWQLLRRAGREAGDWITVDTLAHTVGRGVLDEPYRWAELEQLVYSPSRWERRLVGSTIATIPFVDRRAGREPEVAARGLGLLGQLIGDAEPDVQKALSWAYRSMALVDLEATTSALEDEAERAAMTADGHRAWVIRDVLLKLDPARAARLRGVLVGLRRRRDSPSTSTAAETAARFADLGLGRALPEPPLT
ncbi:MAG: DNA alkylation repair protein [Chloroflexi bacterium]|nr:DNA alkylation repair protein [Chloroflexota bacterium]